VQQAAEAAEKWAGQMKNSCETASAAKAK